MNECQAQELPQSHLLPTWMLHLWNSPSWLGYLGLLCLLFGMQLGGCRQLAQPVCQRCNTHEDCLSTEHCVGADNDGQWLLLQKSRENAGSTARCIPKGSCFCSLGQTQCPAPQLCQQQGGTCFHPTDRQSGSCTQATSCNNDTACPEGQICLHTTPTQPGSCHFPYICQRIPICLENATRPCGTGLKGPCKTGVQRCLNGVWGTCTKGEQAPKPEICNGEDDNCDGAIDNGLTCITDLAGTGEEGDKDDKAQFSTFNNPRGLAAHESTVYIADSSNHRLRALDLKTNLVTTIAGTGKAGFSDGLAKHAQFSFPIGLAFDKKGRLYVADRNNHVIRRLEKRSQGNCRGTPIHETTWCVETFAGTGRSGFRDGSAAQAQFNDPVSLTFDDKDNLYVADSFNHRIRKITSDGVVLTVVGDGLAGRTDGFLDGSSTIPRLNTPSGLVFAVPGLMYIADKGNHTIRELDLTRRHIRTIAGDPGNTGSTDEAGIRARFNAPMGLAYAPREKTAEATGLLYIADRDNHLLRSMTPASRVRTLAGIGKEGSNNGNASTASFASPWQLLLLPNGELLIADADNNKIRKLRTIPAQ